MAQVTKEFAEDFDLWAAELLRDGDTPEGIEEIRRAIREAFAAGGEAADYWRQRVADEAAFIRELRAMGAGINERIRARAEEVA
jgi:hypothetical protein